MRGREPERSGELELDDMQGLLRHGYPYFKAAAYVLLRIDDVGTAKSWLRSLRERPERWLHHASMRAGFVKAWDCSVALAFTAAGLRKLGLGDDTLHSFVAEFQEGMAATHRARLLGDVGASAPSNWDWGRDDAIDVLLIVFGRPTTIMREVAQLIVAAGDGVRIVCQLNARLRGAEPFGFADGISQPHIEGLTWKAPPPGARGLKPGEFVLGYPNEFGRYPASPTVPMNPRAQGLPVHGPSGQADFGRNGTFLVMRQLEQDVEGFMAFVAGSADPEKLAAQMVGRWKSGASLVRHPHRATAATNGLEPDNEFAYHHEDPYGFRCPVGAHIRRANPRDSLSDASGVTPQKAQALVDQHRILRRGRVYKNRHATGLVFVCLNANIERQFEFVQGSWLMNPEFGALSGETDPLLGNAPPEGERTMTLQHHRLARRVAGLEQFVTVKGGAYFFLPGLKAIDYLAKD